MIDIDIQDKTKEQVRFGGTLYTIDFSDENRKKIAAMYAEIKRDMDRLNKEYETLEGNDKTSKKLLSDKAIASIEWERDASIKFIDMLFGEGEGNKIYEKCGKSTEYMSQKVDELATALMLKRESERKAEYQSIRNKYIKHRNNRR